MKIYILRSGLKISPFNDPVSESLILNKKLEDIQKEVFSEFNIEIKLIEKKEEITEFPCLLTYDYVYITKNLFKDFLKEAKSKPNTSNYVLYLRESSFVRQTKALQELKEIESEGTKYYQYDFYFLNKSLDENPSPIMLSTKEFVHTLFFPPHYVGVERIEIPVTSRRILHINHWVHILWANHFALYGMVSDLLEQSKFKLLLSLLKLILKARSLNKWKIAGAVVQKGRNCDIHPTAIIEGSILGDNVKVGANAVIRGCVIDSNVTIKDNAHLEFCVLGEECYVHKKVVLLGVVMYPGSLAGHRLMQLCLLGKRANTTGGGYIIDFNAKREIKVLHKGKYVSCGSRYLGACLGHDVFMGTGIWIQHGREIPNNYILIMEPDRLLSKIPTDLPKNTPLVVHKGTLIPLEEWKKLKNSSENKLKTD